MLGGLIDVSRMDVSRMEGRSPMLRFARRARRSAPRPGVRRAERGASGVEYALLVAAVAAVLVAVLLGIASIVKDAFSTTDDCLSGRGSSACPSSTR